jgi:hypothetical protein
MASTRSQDILLPSDDEVAVPVRTRLAAFVPIALAVLGVAAIMMGRVSFAEVSANATPIGVDPVATGSIQTVVPAKTD